MNPETAQWLLAGAHAFQKNNELAFWNGIPRQTFASLLIALFRADDFGEAVRFLEQIVAEEISAPSIPPDLEKLMRDLETAQDQNEEIRKKASAQVEKFLEEQKKLAARKIEPIYPLPPLPTAKTEKQPPKEETAIAEKIAAEIEARLKTEGAVSEDLAREISQKASQPLTHRLVLAYPVEIVAQNYNQLLTDFWPEVETEIQKEMPVVGPEEEEQKELVLAKNNLVKEIKKELVAANKELASQPELVEKISQEIGQSINEKLSSFPIQEITSNDYQEFLVNFWPEIDQKLQTVNLNLTKNQAQKFIKIVAATTQPAAQTLTSSTQRLIFKTDLGKSPQEEGLAFVPVYTILQPQVAVSFAKKAALSPIVKTLQALDKISGNELQGNAVSEWRGLLHQGLAANDIRASILFFQQAGVSPQNSQLKKLEVKELRLRAYEHKHRFTSSVLKNYHEFSKITGRRQIFSKEIKSFLPRLANPPVWLKKQSYSLQLRKVLDAFGLALKTHEKVTLGPGKNIVKLVLPDKLTRLLTLGKIKSFTKVKALLYQKTLGAVFAKVGKTVVGKGLKKAATWALSRLGLAAIPTGVTQVIAVGLFAFDILKLGLKLFKRLGASRWGVVTLGAILGAAGLFLALPLPIAIAFVGAGALLAGLGFLGGAAGLAGGLLAGAGSLLGGVLGTASGLLSSLSTLSLPAIVPTIAAIGGTAAAGTFTLLTIVNTAASFIPRPQAPKVAPGTSIISFYLDVQKSVSPKDNFENEELPATITYTVKVSAKDKKLLRVKINDNVSVDKEGTVPALPPPRSWNVPEIATASSWTQSYPLVLNKGFENSAVNNEIIVTADVDGGSTGETANARQTITIGAPPQDCPSGWPTDHGIITQGPGGTFSHNNAEAVDISQPRHTITRATHRGTVHNYPITNNPYSPLYGNLVVIEGACRGQAIKTLYAHLIEFSAKDGSLVKRGDPIGKINNTGNSFGDHLHYEFRGLNAGPPYIPRVVPRGCSSNDGSACGNISW